MNEVVERRKSLITLRNIMKVISFLCAIFVFCPSFLVSCSDKKMEVSVMTAVKGVTSLGETIVEPYPIMLICLLLPIAISISLFVKNLSDEKCAWIITICSLVDIVIWILFRAKVKEMAEKAYCTVETTGWYVINIIVLCMIMLASLLIGIKKIEMDMELNLIFNKMKDMETLKNIPRNIVLGGGAGIVAIIVTFFVAINMKPTINLDKYLIIEASGYNGYGSIKARLDWDAIDEKYGERIKYTREADTYGLITQYSSPISVLKKVIDIELNVVNSKRVSNGEEISYTWKISDDLEK